MKLNALLMFSISSLTLSSFTLNNKPKYSSGNLVTNNCVLVNVASNPYYEIGNIDISPSDSDYMYSPFCVKMKRKIRNPKLYVTISYKNKANEEVFIYNKFDTSLEFNTSLNTFFGEIKVNLTELASEVTFNCLVTMARGANKANFDFTISNPREVQKMKKTNPNFVYTSFVKSYSESVGRNYFTRYNFYNQQGFENKLYYYNHFDFYKYLYFKSNDPYCINDASIYIYDPNTTLFNNATFKHQDFNQNYKFFNLISVQDKEPEVYRFTFGKQYYVDPVTNIMYDTNSSGLIPSTSSIYLPLKHYNLFKNANFGLLIDIDAYALRYRLLYEFQVNYLEHYYKDEFVIYKEIVKTTKDPTMKEITL